MASAKADVIPIGDMVSIGTDRAGTSFGAGVDFGHSAHGDTSVGSRVFGEGSNSREHSLGRAHPLAHELIG